MPLRTKTSEWPTFTRSAPEAVTYDVSEPDIVLITVPPGSAWNTGLHWHEEHDEYFEVMAGSILLTVGRSTRRVTHEDGVLEIPRFTVHQWFRDPCDATSDDVVVKERTIPADGQKEGFFRTLNSFLMEPVPKSMHEPMPWPLCWLETFTENWVVVVQLFIIFKHFDNYPVLVSRGSGFLSWAVTHVCLAVAQVFGGLLGLQAVYPEYLGGHTSGTRRAGGDRKEM